MQAFWDQLNYSDLNEASCAAIDWSLVNFKKAVKNNFDLSKVDWEEVDPRRSTTPSIGLQIITKETPEKLIGHGQFQKFKLNNLENINDLLFDKLEAKLQILKWDQINYSDLNEALVMPLIGA